MLLDARARQRGETRAAAGKHMDRLHGRSKLKLGEDRPYLEILLEVLRMYGRGLVLGSRHVYQALPRLLTLWFEHGGGGQGGPAAAAPSAKDRECAAAVAALMQELARSVPLHVWLTALPQLTSRICHSDAEVAGVTRGIITRVTQVYPHQVR